MITFARARRFGRIAEFHTLYLAFFLASFVIHLAASAGGSKSAAPAADLEDNEFAEFEEFDDENEQQTISASNREPPVAKIKTPPSDSPRSEQQEISPDVPKQKAPRAEEYEEDDEQDHEGIVEEEPSENDYSHVKDDDDFENFGDDKASGGRQSQRQKDKIIGGKQQQPQTLKITDVPAHLINNWTNFQLEMIVLIGLAAYLLNYIYGKTKNQTLANAWFEAHRELLESNFHVVGDDGTQQEPTHGVLMKESDNSYSLWCTGRQGCSGMLVQLKFIKRQDIVSLVMQLFRPKYDRVVVRINLSNDEGDTFVYAYGQKKSVTKLAKDMMDLSMFCTEKKNADKAGLPANFTIFSEIAEASALILDNKVLSTTAKFEECVDYVHYSDQYSGMKPQDGDNQTKLPETNKVLIFSFNIPGQLSASEQHIDDTRPLMSLAFYMFEKVRRIRLSREGKQKADKNRQSATESFLKTTHAQRQEAAQQRREDKVRERKERVLAEEDPDKQRRMEKVEIKREMKKKQPKVKQLKIKAG